VGPPLDVTEHGAATPVVLAVVALVVFLLHGVVLIGSGAATRVHATTAAECAALAGAQELANGGTTRDAERAARQLADENGATVQRIAVDGSRVDVSVSIGSEPNLASARAAAIVDELS